MGYFVQIANMPEATKLYDTVVTWWDAYIVVLIVTGATTAKVEAGNTGIKNIKRTGRGFRNAENYRTRILLTSAARTEREYPPQQGHSPRTGELLRANHGDYVNELWLADTTEHWAQPGYAHLCATKGTFSGRIVGHAIGDQMKARLGERPGQRDVPVS